MLKFIPLSMPNLQGNEIKYLTEAIRSTYVSSVGKYVLSFEQKIVQLTKSKYAVACQNGTAGLQISLLLSGVQPGDEVLVPTLTFIAPVNTVKYVNAEPVFMDCDHTLNIDLEKLEDFCKNECQLTSKGLRNKRSRRIIRSIIVVHIFGSACDMDSLMKICRKYHLSVIEDATESLGTYFIKGRYKDRFTGTIGQAGVFSFNGNKIITTGSGGMIVTDKKQLADKAKYLTTQAKDDSVRYIHHEIGYNFRMTNIQAALGMAQLEKLKGFIKIKKQNYNLYKKELEEIDGLKMLVFPDYIKPNYWFYSLIVDKKKYGFDIMQIMKHLKNKNIETRPIWYLNHLQKPYKNNQSYKIEKAPWFLKRVLNLPCSSNLSQDDVYSVIKSIKEIKR